VLLIKFELFTFFLISSLLQSRLETGLDYSLIAVRLADYL